MLFWVGLLIAGLFAWVTIKMGLYETWALLFNILISVYLGVFLGSAVANSDLLSGISYSSIIVTAVIAIGTFLILQGISYIFFTSQFNVSIPKIFDVIGSGFLGFWTGLLIWSFLIMLILTTPISQNTAFQKIGLDNYAQQASISYVSWWCDKINGIVGNSKNEQTTKDLIDVLLKKLQEAQTEAKTKESAKPEEPKEAIKPIKAVEPNEKPEFEPPPEPDAPPEPEESQETTPEKTEPAEKPEEAPESDEPPEPDAPPEPDSDSNKSDTKDEEGFEAPPEADL
ncbi:MAG: CvpA family protein [Planctomycetota bacterium]|jgi:hypothetical protein